ncbi:MAG: hypothetical protein DKT66_05655 [Candidatus Melainabacteria bacterium]|nr:MAG: hypothetical protein DKT66_05655 [Candidatus Melainabacteria bacterium]
MHDGIFDFYFCDKCRAYVLDEKKGDAKRGILPNTAVQKLSDNWKCPICGGSSNELRPVTMLDHIMKSEILKPSLSGTRST